MHLRPEDEKSSDLLGAGARLTVSRKCMVVSSLGNVHACIMFADVWFCTIGVRACCSEDVLQGGRRGACHFPHSAFLGSNITRSVDLLRPFIALCHIS